MAEAKTSVSETVEPNIPNSEIKKRERHTGPSWDDVASKLLQEKLLLTALELHTELVEAGYELPRFRDYFSNPANFEQYTPKTYADLHSGSVHSGLSLPRSSSQTTLDSLDWGHLSEDGERAVDERVAVLEFELRKARETIQGLRTNLTQATESKPSVEKEEADKPALIASLSSIRPHEKRTLNFLINEYLVTNSYKLTAITFADENDDQDFEHWDDVGLNTGRPPNLVLLLRESGHSITHLTSCASQTDNNSQCQISHLEECRRKLQEELNEMNSKYAAQERELQKLKQRTPTPSITPLTSPKKHTDRTQAEGHMYIAEKLSPLDVDGDGRESPEGISDSEETSGGGGGFVMVTTAAVPLRTQTIGSSVEAESQDNNENIKNVNGQEANPEGKDLVEAVSGYEDPSESIEVLIQASHEEAQDTVSEKLSEAMENKMTLNEEEDTVKPEMSLQESSHVDNTSDSISMDESCITQDSHLQAADVRITNSVVGSEAATEKYLAQLKTEAKKLLRASSKRCPPEAFEEQILQASLCHTVRRNSRVQAEVATLGQGSQELLDVVASSLHNIAPNVILAKREELLPLLVCGVSMHKDGRERERLLHLLFNLIKRPDEEQCSTILTGIVGLARVLGATKLEAELLPQCWEQLTHKYVERRLLVAKSTAALAPYTPPPLRNSLLLSMLLQLLAPGGEKETKVREAALTSLALLVTFLDDQDKLPVLVDTLLHCLENQGTVVDSIPNTSLDTSHMVVRSQASPRAIDLFISSLAMWALETNMLNHVLDPLLIRLNQLAMLFKQQQGNLQAAQVPGQQPIISVIEALIKTVPFILAMLINSVPAVDDEDNAITSVTSVSACSALEELEVIIGSKSKAEYGLSKLHHYVSKEWFKSWKELEYVTQKFISAVVEVLCFIDASAVPVIQAFIKLFSQLPICLGAHLTASSIIPIFLKHLSIDESALEAVRLGNTGLTGSLVVVYTVSLLASNQGCCDRPGELEVFLTRQISILALCRAQPDALYVTISTLLQSQRNQEAVLGALWSCLVHKSCVVRACSAGLWSVVVGSVEDAALGSRVVPALVTLATDPDMQVKASAVHPLATVITTTTNTEVLDKVWLQLETLCEDPSVLENLDFQLALARTCSLLAHTAHPRLIHQFLLPRLCRLAMDGKHSEEEAVILGVGLLEAYSALTCCHLADHVVAHFVLPPLTQLQKTLGSTTFENMETITDLIREYSLRAQSSQGQERRKSNLSLSGALPVHPGVDDMRNKMSKMFASRPTANALQARAQAINVSLPGFLKKK
ncbi:RAB11-binding protein RELCH homolog [Panulirus ornatus]|uniref:RAB11-binding protein RELCH homolog n=1 Tax=Panulirus ornatus TaxID=150431 RepID=UPI003A87D20E